MWFTHFIWLCFVWLETLTMIFSMTCSFHVKISAATSWSRILRSYLRNLFFILANIRNSAFIHVSDFLDSILPYLLNRVLDVTWNEFHNLLLALKLVIDLFLYNLAEFLYQTIFIYIIPYISICCLESLWWSQTPTIEFGCIKIFFT
jgi:hypothetical protein